MNKIYLSIAILLSTISGNLLIASEEKTSETSASQLLSKAEIDEYTQTRGNVMIKISNQITNFRHNHLEYSSQEKQNAIDLLKEISRTFNEEIVCVQMHQTANHPRVTELKNQRKKLVAELENYIL